MARALGFSVHTGWALVLAVEGPPGKARVLSRRRLQLYTRFDEGAFYHVAAEQPLATARRTIAAAHKAAAQRATDALRDFCAALPAGLPPGVAGMVLGTARLPEDIAAILRAHPLVHTAEGVLYREAFAKACAALDLAVRGTPARELAATAAKALRIDAAEIPARLAQVGKQAGRPWTRDEKDAYLAAVVALAGRKPTRSAPPRTLRRATS